MDKLVCVDDFESVGFKILKKDALDYFRTGADEEITLSNNREAFKRWAIRPRMLRDVSVRNLSKIVLGKTTAIPIGISPTAMQKLAHADGELGNAKTAELLNTVFILSTLSSASLEEVAAAAPLGRKWFQLYMCKNSDTVVNLIRRAEKCGFEAIVLTVDTPYLGKRRANVRDQFVPPSHIRMANFAKPRNAADLSKVAQSLYSASDMSTGDFTGLKLTWETVAWLKRVTRLPIIVKGILSRDDVNDAVQHGVAGIFVSNHGGRQLDTVPATIDVLEGIIRAVNGRCEVYFDGGVRTGSDVFKALALGADMVFAGRPFLWGLVVGGQEGSKRVLEILRDELDLTMALAGFPDVCKIDRQAIIRYSSL